MKDKFDKIIALPDGKIIAIRGKQKFGFENFQTFKKVTECMAKAKNEKDFKRLLKTHNIGENR